MFAPAVALAAVLAATSCCSSAGAQRTHAVYMRAMNFDNPFDYANDALPKINRLTIETADSGGSSWSGVPALWSPRTQDASYDPVGSLDLSYHFAGNVTTTTAGAAYIRVTVHDDEAEGLVAIDMSTLDEGEDAYATVAVSGPFRGVERGTYTHAANLRRTQLSVRLDAVTLPPRGACALCVYLAPGTYTRVLAQWTLQFELLSGAGDSLVPAHVFYNPTLIITQDYSSPPLSLTNYMTANATTYAGNTTLIPRNASLSLSWLNVDNSLVEPGPVLPASGAPSIEAGVVYRTYMYYDSTKTYVVKIIPEHVRYAAQQDGGAATEDPSTGSTPVGNTTSDSSTDSGSPALTPSAASVCAVSVLSFLVFTAVAPL